MSISCCTALTSRHCNVCRSRSYSWRYTSTFINLGVGDDCRWLQVSCELTSLGSALKFGDLCQTQIKPSANIYRFTNPSSLAPPPKSGGADADFTDPTANGDWSYFLLTEFRHGGNLAPGFGVNNGHDEGIGSDKIYPYASENQAVKIMIRETL